ncbi:MAG: MT-A70 family methyltransferase, partial [Gemmatimonadota bacterium]
KAYARLAKNRDLEVDAAEIRLRSERRLGELIAEQKRTVGLAKGGQPYQGRSTPSESEGVTPTLKDAGIDWKLSARAQRLAAVPEGKFKSMVSDWRERVSQETERVTANLVREGERSQRDDSLPRPAPPVGRYDVIYADPPWRYEYVKTESRAIENHYPTMSREEIAALSVPAIDDCVLFLWATSPKLADAMYVIQEWRFVYRTCAVWDKGQIGMGYYFRQQHELLLVATRGNPGTPEPSERVGSVVHSPRADHSQKPGIFYELIERMYPHAARCELFARNERVGWASWGNESGVPA